MKILILSGTPKREGLCHLCVEAAETGAAHSGADWETVRLCDYPLARCAVCGDGWGTCREEHVCCHGGDGFSDLQRKVAEAGAYILITPVYWGEMSEIMKAFTDRLRRCEATKGEYGAMAGKPALLVASPGGSGNGMVSCLEQMERLSRHLGTSVFDMVGVTFRSLAYKLPVVTEAAAAMIRAAG